MPYEIVSFKFELIKQKPFIDMNPNGRVRGKFLSRPWNQGALVAPNTTGIGLSRYLIAIEDPNTDITLWETGAIITYLIEVYDKAHVLSYETLKERHHCNQWRKKPPI